MNLQNFDLARKICNDYLKYTKKAGENTKSYQKALANKIFLSLFWNDLQEFVEYSQSYEQVTKTVYGASSMEYALAAKSLGQGKTKIGFFQEAYQKLLGCYDIYKAKFGSEVNSESSEVLANMALIKSYWREYEDAANLIKKAKEIELKVTSKSSVNYSQILKIEQIIKRDKEKLIREGILPPEKGDTHSRVKVAATLVGIGLAIFGAVYYIKRKGSS